MEKNNNYKKIGVWLDHSKAHFIDVSKGPAIVETVYSDRESRLRFKGETSVDERLGGARTTNNEHHRHNREIEIMSAFYKLLTGTLKRYDDIYLFGPTSAKDELYNSLKSDIHFKQKILNVRSADKLTENQMVAEVKKFYNI